MLIIGHRGAAGLAPENTLEALRAGVEADADILEFDVRLTKDLIPVLIHDATTMRTYHKRLTVAKHTLTELTELVGPLTTLEDVLDEFFGQILLNIELKSKGSGQVVATLLKNKYIHKNSDWDAVLLSSFKGKELSAVRAVSQRANLAVLHDQNPFIFIAYQRRLHLTAVGFHRLYVNQFALEIAKKTGLFAYAYTVDRPRTAEILQQKGIDAVVTNRPDVVSERFNRLRIES